jgi:predicted permease
LVTGEESLAMLHDVKHAVRLLWQSKGWTAIVLISLALGIGANTALFTAVNGLLLQTIAVPDPESLVTLKGAGDNNMRRSSSDYGFSEPYRGKQVRASFSYAIYEALRASNQTLTDMFACAPYSSLNVSVDGTSDIATGFIVSGNYFRVLQLPVAIGRTLDESDDRPDAEAAAVISHAFWRRRFASNPAVLGRVVRMNNVPVTIVGVTGPEFTGIQRLGALAPEVTFPLALDARFNPANAKRNTQPTNYWLLVMGRLKPGATLAQVKGNLEGPFHAAARGGMASFMAGLTAEQRKLSTNQQRGDVVPELIALSGSRGFYDLDTNTQRSAAILAAVVTLLLLIVCANVANLLLSRAVTRQKEVAVRLSMGAPRRRIVRQMLTESLMLSGLGGLLGALVGYWSKRLLPFGQNVGMDWTVLGFVAAVSIATGVIFGILPALRATKIDLAGTMKESSRSVTGARAWLSKGLLVTQVAVSLVLLIGAGLFLRTLHNLRSVDVGFNANNILMFRINPALNRYEPERITQVLQNTQTTLEALPGVRSVTMTRTALLSGSTSITGMFVQGDKQTQAHDIHVMSVSPTFFKTMEIPLLVGRDFDARDDLKPTTAAIVNETAVKKYFGGRSPIGQRIGSSLEQNAETEIIGVIRDTKYDSLRDPAPPTMYRSLGPTAPNVTVVVRTAGDPSTMIEPVRTAMSRVDPDVPVTGVTTQTEQVEGRFGQERLFAMAFSLFGALALLLACIGLFGLMSYSVSRRTNEIGIRMALGAQRAGVVRMVLGESIVMVTIGVVLGLAVALATGRFVAAVLFGLPPNDAWTVAAAIAMMGAVSCVAGYLPARRASRVDPMVALRYE